MLTCHTVTLAITPWARTW